MKMVATFQRQVSSQGQFLVPPLLDPNGSQREQDHCGQTRGLVMARSPHPILLVSLQGPMQEIPGHLLILVQPLDDKGLKPPGMESRGEVFAPRVPCFAWLWMILGQVLFSLELTLWPQGGYSLLPYPTRPRLLQP